MLTDQELRDGATEQQTAWESRKTDGVLPCAPIVRAGYYKGSKDGSGLRANGDRSLGATAVPRLDRDEVTP